MDLYRLSSYTIPVRLDDPEGRYLLTHGYTGAVDIASAGVVDFIRHHESFTKEEVPFSEETFENLRTRGYLTVRTLQEERRLVKIMSKAFHRNSLTGSKGFMFLVTYDCNFRCPYCYEGDGSQWSHSVLTKELVDKAYETMAEIEPEDKKRQKSITLYGGEPLMAVNKELVHYIVEEGKKRGYRFSAITNAYDLHEFEDLLGKDSIYHLQITVDGNRDWHNKRRIHYIEGGNTFDRIIENIGIALKHEVAVNVRSNTDANNFESVQSLKEVFEELGYTKYRTFNYHSALLRGAENIVPEDVRLLEAAEKRHAVVPDAKNIAYLSRKEYNRRNANAESGHRYQEYGIYEKLFSAMSGKKLVSFHSVFCGVQTGSYIFDPEGRIYSCWEMVGTDKHVMGTYKDKLEWSDEEIAKWHSRHVGSQKECSRCKYAFLCGGGCVAKALQSGRGFERGYCDNYADMFKIAAKKAYENFQTAQTKEP